MPAIQKLSCQARVFAAADTASAAASPVSPAIANPSTATATRPIDSMNWKNPVPFPRVSAGSVSARYIGITTLMSPWLTPWIARPDIIVANDPPERQMSGTDTVSAAAAGAMVGLRPIRSASGPANSAEATAPITTAPTISESWASVNAVVTFRYGSAAAMTPMSMP